MSHPLDLSRPGFWAQLTWVLRKEAWLEWRTRARAAALFTFALATLLLFSFAVGPDAKALAKNASGYLGLALLLASTLSLSESMRVERENLALEGLLLLPLDARALFVGKACASAALLLGLSLVLLPLALALYGISIALGWTQLLSVLALGSLAISAPGTLYAAIASRARARDVLLPLLLFPLLVPALLSFSKALRLVFEGDPMGQLASWRGLLVAFNLVYWSLGFVLFPKVVED
ncbi:MAG: heme exporter protein CcmB [Myxococcaceae bacterium]